MIKWQCFVIMLLLVFWTVYWFLLQHSQNGAKVGLVVYMENNTMIDK